MKSHKTDPIVTTAWILLLFILGFGFGVAVGRAVVTMLNWK